MQILIADDEPVSQTLARAALAGAAGEVLSVPDGAAAWAAIQARTAPMLVILDRSMPCVDGLELCGRVRRGASYPPVYIVMVTAANEPGDVAAGLEAGADDYVAKPFDVAELRARAHVGLRMLVLQESLARRVSELEAALASVKQLRGLLPMCAYCKKIRVDDRYWQKLESYLAERSEAQFSHGICPDCYPDVLKELDGV